MSYILDALRRAEAERERGEVPSLQSQQHPVIEDDAARRPRPLVWAVVGLSAALLAVIAWSLFGAPAPARAPVEGSVAPSLAPAPLPVAPAVAQPGPTSAAPPIAGTTNAVPNTAAASPAAPKAMGPGLGEELEPSARRSARSTAPRPRHEEARANAAARSATTGAARTGAEDHVYTPATLPEEIRRELPKVAINGSSYSSDPASRMVIINGQVFHEGDRLAPGLVLEKIRLKSAVLAYKGWRYELVF